MYIYNDILFKYKTSELHDDDRIIKLLYNSKHLSFWLITLICNTNQILYIAQVTIICVKL